jgi:hypothetical protein
VLSQVSTLCDGIVDGIEWYVTENGIILMILLAGSHVCRWLQEEKPYAFQYCSTSPTCSNSVEMQCAEVRQSASSIVTTTRPLGDKRMRNMLE